MLQYVLFLFLSDNRDLAAVVVVYSFAHQLMLVRPNLALEFPLWWNQPTVLRFYRHPDVIRRDWKLRLAKDKFNLFEIPLLPRGIPSS